MGWSQHLTGSYFITDVEVEDILEVIKAGHATPGWPWNRQQWGWSTECDIHRDYQDQILVFSGAWFSVGTDLPERFERAAQSRGHTVALGPRTG
jgi:hypothetical protein